MCSCQEVYWELDQIMQQYIWSVDEYFFQFTVNESPTNHINQVIFLTGISPKSGHINQVTLNVSRKVDDYMKLHYLMG